MPDLLTSAIAIVGLKYVGPPAADLVKDFLGRVLSPTANAAGAALAYPLEEWQRKRVERAHQLILDGAKLVASAGCEPLPVPGRTLMPILEKGSLEEDEDLYRAWVGLLASAALDPNAVLPSFVAVLSELSPAEAKTMNWLYEKGHPMMDTIGAVGFFADVTQYTHLIAFENLDRLRLIQPFSDPAIATIDRYDYVSLTVFGMAFIDACRVRRR